MFNKRFLHRIAFSLTCGRNQSSTGRKPQSLIIVRLIKL